ncbi:Spx/MgsR family RNA polymerase-binding regulatory protein [bacterium]|nr:Spx/MgsR family RNA polymerase-binding regulatory protein [bacterium]MBU1994071.1 Spx/MgsR family RNA polymerase-binding regulatory protein [bacterium]
MVKVYGIKNCDSVKKALSFFKAHHIEHELHDFKTKSVSCDEVSRWLGHVEIKTLFNSRSTTYRELQLKELNLDEKNKIQWLCKENMLIKRPVIEFEKAVIVGFDEDYYRGVFL